MQTSVRNAFRLSWFIPLLILVVSVAPDAVAQNGNGPLQRFRNYFVTGDYVVAGWHKTSNDGTYSTGTISIPDTTPETQAFVSPGVPANIPTSVPVGADIVAAYLYWESVETSKTSLAGQVGFFKPSNAPGDGVQITGFILGNPNAPSSWSAGGCAGDNSGSKTIRVYRADVRPYLNLNNANGALGFTNSASFQVKLPDTGANQQPYTLGATLLIVYRILSPSVPLNAIAIFDGSFNPSNTSTGMQEMIDGFYEADGSPVKVTHIVGNGQPNKIENVSLINASQTVTPLLPVVPGAVTAFPGFYNTGLISTPWDNPTWLVGGAVSAEDSQATTTVTPNSQNKGCVTWGAVVMSTTVPDQDHDGLLDKWERSENQGYTDLATLHWVPLPGSHPDIPDIFAEIDYLSDLGSNNIAGTSAHTHLPKQAALDEVGDAFLAKGVNIHFDVGLHQGDSVPLYQNAIDGSGPDPYIIQYDTGKGAGTGGNSIPESVGVCTDPVGTDVGLCPFKPATPARSVVGWKEGFFYVQNQWPVTDSSGNQQMVGLGNFAPERAAAYHYVLFGHALGENRSVWSLNPGNQPAPYLQSITNNGDGTATVTVVSTPAMAIPGDCSSDRVIITGAIAQPALNGIFRVTQPKQCLTTNTSGTTSTTFTIKNPNLPFTQATYDSVHEPQLAVMYGGPTTSSGHSDIAGGDTAITFGLWPGDNASGCAVDPTLFNPSVTSPVPYCDDQVGTVQAQAGTLMHELGHTLGLTHGGTYYANEKNSPPSVPTYGMNCKPNDLTVMSYLFQVHGFPDSQTVDYSGRTLDTLSETVSSDTLSNETALNETKGIGTDPPEFTTGSHLTRWYASTLSPLDAMLGTSFATLHCDGTPLLKDPNTGKTEQFVRVDGQSYGLSPNPVDWNNDLTIKDPVGTLDVNFNGFAGDTGNLGVNEWTPDAVRVAPTDQNPSFYTIGVDLRQVDARQNSAGLSGAPGSPSGIIGGGGTPSGVIGGGGTPSGIIGGGGSPSGLTGGGGTPSGVIGGGGVELDLTAANSVVDPPNGLQGTWNKSINAVVLTWSHPAFGQVQAYLVYRLLGMVSATNPLTSATLIAKVSGTPPVTTYSDKKASPNKTYTYFVVSQIQGNRNSGRSNTTVVQTF